MSFKIGPHIIENRLVVAPMAGVTDRPFRQLCKKLGAGLAVSEMVSSNSLLWGSEKTLRRANHEGETEPRSVQIAGACPDMMAEAAKHNADKGADIIDINMGCPAKKVCNVMAGSALLQYPDLVERILNAVVKAVDIPVTLKIRTGWNASNRNGVAIAKIAEDAGIQALAVHGRTRACGYKGQAEYDTIAEIKSQVSFPVIANGDICTPEDAASVLQKTQADAVMIGRAAQGRPWIFREIDYYLRTGDYLPEPEPEEIRDIMMGHLHNLYDFYGEHRGVRVARKHVSWYTKGQRHGAAFRQSFNRIETLEEQVQAAKLFFEELINNKRALAA